MRPTRGRSRTRSQNQSEGDRKSYQGDLRDESDDDSYVACEDVSQYQEEESQCLTPDAQTSNKPGGSKGRSSERIRQKRNREFRMPSREDIFNEIEEMETTSPSKRTPSRYKTSKEFNSFSRVTHRYNQDIVSDNEGSSLDEFVVDDDQASKSESSSSESEDSRHTNRRDQTKKKDSSSAARRRIIMSSSSSSEEDQEEPKRSEKKRRRIVTPKSSSSEDETLDPSTQAAHTPNHQSRASDILSQDAAKPEQGLIEEDTQSDASESLISHTSSSRQISLRKGDASNVSTTGSDLPSSREDHVTHVARKELSKKDTVIIDPDANNQISNEDDTCYLVSTESLYQNLAQSILESEENQPENIPEKSPKYSKKNEEPEPGPSVLQCKSKETPKSEMAEYYPIFNKSPNKGSASKNSASHGKDASPLSGETDELKTSTPRGEDCPDSLAIVSDEEDTSSIIIENDEDSLIIVSDGDNEAEEPRNRVARSLDFVQDSLIIESDDDEWEDVALTSPSGRRLPNQQSHRDRSLDLTTDSLLIESDEHTEEEERAITCTPGGNRNNDYLNPRGIDFVQDSLILESDDDEWEDVALTSPSGRRLPNQQSHRDRSLDLNTDSLLVESDEHREGEEGAITCTSGGIRTNSNLKPRGIREARSDVEIIDSETDSGAASDTSRSESSESEEDGLNISRSEFMKKKKDAWRSKFDALKERRAKRKKST